MKMVLSAIAMSAAMVATDASAQGVNLTGPYRCVAGCASARPGLAFVTQNGWELNLALRYALARLSHRCSSAGLR